jgi:hypothetical protein
MGTLNTNTYGDLEPFPGEVALTAGAVSTTAAGTIAGTTSAGAAPTITAVTANGNYGTYTLNPVTGGGAQAAGETSHVYFPQSRSRTPQAVRVTVVDITTPSTPAAVAAYASSVTSAGFAVSTIALTTAHNYQVTYEVLP